MVDWLDEVAGPGYSQAVLWTLLALLVLVILLGVLKLYRTATFGTYVAGGRNRKARLAISDATAIDGSRRLVLVRRDDVEHLLLIGGSSDIVVERDIRIGQQRRAAPPAEREAVPAAVPPPEPAPIAAPPPAPPVPPRPRAPEPARPQQAAQRPVVDRPAPPAPRPAEVRAPAGPRPAPGRAQPAGETPRVEPASRQPAEAATPAPKPASTAVEPPADDLDTALLKELEVSLDSDDVTPEPTKPSLDEEMARLLGELSNPRR